MNRNLYTICLLVFSFALVVKADLTFPAVFEVIEENPSEFRLTLTVPLIKGRYMKARPVVPDGFRSEGEPEARAGASSLTRTWHVEADPRSLHGAAFGLEGLLGTTQEVRFLLTTLDGRRHETVLRSTRQLFFVPPAPSVGRLAASSAREGLRHALRNVGVWSVLTCILLSGMSMRRRAGIAMAISAAFIGSLAALIVFPRTGLSDVEGGLMTGFHVAGIVAGLVGAVAVIGLLRSLTSDGVRLRMHTYAGILATAWIFYEGMGVLLLHGPVWLVWLERISDGVVHRWFWPFAADWAMARLRVPWLSGGTLVLAVVALFRLQSLRPKAWVGGGLLTASLVVLPWGATSLAVPFRSPQAPSPAQAGRILEPMLSRIYQALSVENESQAYDRLAADVTGGLVTDLYLDSRRGLVSGIRQGASVTVKEVQVIEVGDPQPADAQSPGPVYACEWSVIAKVTHWQHTHERRNLYEGNVRLVVENDRWKLAELGLRSEEREVVPGSFQSR